VIYDIVSFWFHPFVVVTDVGLIVCSVSLLRKPTRENARRVKKLVLVCFVFGLLAYIFGAL
jgi:hypothetical protein